MGTRIQNLVPAQANHPGEHIQDEIDARGISQAELARKMGIKNRSLLNEIIKGQRNLTARHALMLEKVTAIKAEYWMNLQAKYELNKARIEESVLQREQAMEQWDSVKDFVAVKYYRKEKVITGDPVKDMPMIQAIFDTVEAEKILAEYQEPAFARFRKSERLQVDEINVLGWSKLAEYNASKEEVADFNPDSWESLEPELRTIIRKNRKVKENVKAVLANFGIKLIYQNKAEKAPIDGYAFWSGDNPTIALTLRHKRLDNFAFTLYHELGHVFLHLIQDKSREVIDLLARYDKEHQKSKEEREANAFAQDHLIPREVSEKLFACSPISDLIIKRIAEEINIHPSIVLGRVCHEFRNFRVHTRISHEIG